MLSRAKDAFLINANERIRRRAAGQGAAHAVVIVWK
jgi:hypothetical protein